MPISILHRVGGRLCGHCAIFIAIAGGAVQGMPNPSRLSGMFADKLDAINESVWAGEWETYVTGYAWHLPHGYKETTRARLNETTWGGGFGRSMRDEDGDRHSVYFMAFADSHRSPQLNLGYAWQQYWSPTRNFSIGTGYLAFLFSREDVADRFPLPAILPCASVRYRNIEVVGLFVPRVSRDIKGDVLFVYLRIPLRSERRREASDRGRLAGIR